MHRIAGHRCGGACLALLAFSAFAVIPTVDAAASLVLVGEDKSAFDELVVRYSASSFNSCEFSGRHTVKFDQGEVLVELIPLVAPRIACLGSPVSRYEVYVGRFPQGRYKVRVRVAEPQPGSVVSSIPPDRDEASIEIDLPDRESVGGKGPLQDYTGAYWDSEDSGWQFNVVHQDNDQLTIIWAAHDEDSNPAWYFTLPGTWEQVQPNIFYSAPLARTRRGPSILSPEPSGVDVKSETVGFVRIAGFPSSVLFLSYEIDGKATTRYVRRYVQPDP